jgi:ubiquinone/menaquinone biosynthesis C-methylase UbiE
MKNYDENSESQSYWNEEGGNKWAENIDIVESIIEPLSEILIEKIAAKNGENVLDVGCGGGITSIKLANMVSPAGSVLGVDVSEPIISIAQKRAEAIDNISFQQRDAAAVELGADHFDIITSRFGVMFFDDPVSAFKNLHSSLKNTGRLIFLCWRALDENPWIADPAKAAFEIVPPPADAEKPDPKAPGPFSLADKEHLISILTSAGFNNIDLEPVDSDLPMGEPEQAISFLMKMGPAAEILKEATDDKRAEVAIAMQKILSKYEKDGETRIPSATWLVSASK